MQCKTKHQKFQLNFFFFKDDCHTGEESAASSSRKENKFHTEETSVLDLSVKKELVVATRGNEEKEMVAIRGDEKKEVVAIGGDEEKKVVAIGGDEEKEAVAIIMDEEKEVVAIGGDEENEVVAIGGDEENEVVAIGGDEEKEAVAIRGDEEKEVVAIRGDEEKEKEKEDDNDLDQNTEKNIQLIVNQIKKYNECVCHFCGIQFEDRSFYQSHLSDYRIYSKTGDIAYKCLECNEVLDESKELEDHYVEIHKINFDCFICKSRFTYKKALTRHFKNYHNYKLLSCNICDFSTYITSKFYHHNKCHTRFIGYKCKYCSFKANTERYIIKHEEEDHKNK